MSRIGKKTIKVPPEVKVDLELDGTLQVCGPIGSMKWRLPAEVGCFIRENCISVTTSSQTRAVGALHGLSRSIIANMVQGVFQGYTKDLEIIGVGFKAIVQAGRLNLSLGYSHPVDYLIPSNIKITVTDNTKIKVFGADKQVVGQVAADIRSYYPPEPYKGKGIRYLNEQVRRKEGKTVQ